ncbi:alpha/beta hydrolase [Qiania dongpingensis]|uniref:Alpha/beta hydrolase n=1 Tax=Qiania dongpingensis TaxID=2763669 RepID=A0A7G9G7M2_9FIRM|nr:alpha/beta hydrolase [Qiania dongpingensis]QNM06804.1 alpha/beta hydrolase [Qiania dongpingensis]
MKKWMRYAAGAAGILTAADLLSSWFIFQGLLGSQKSGGLRDSCDRQTNGCLLREVEIHAFDGTKLRGLLTGREASDKTVIFVHGYRGDGMRDGCAFVPMYERLGFQVLLVDDRCHGKSEGTYMGFGCLDRLDCQSWCRYLAGRFGENHKIILHGVSMGAAAVLSSLGEKLPSQVKCAVSDCSFASGWEELRHQLRKRYHLPAFPILYTVELFCRWKAGYSLKGYSPVTQVEKSEIPVLFIHGDADELVPVSMVYQLYHACASEKRIYIASGAAHAKSYESDEAVYEKMVRQFLKDSGVM